MAYTTIDDPTIFFNTVLYTGNGGTNNVTGVGFQPDWVWLKQRNSDNRSHHVYDVVRGVQKFLHIDATTVEATQTNAISSFDSDGFTVGNNINLNGSSDTYASFNWKAGGSSTSSNSDGSITSTVSANTTAGFSIVTYTSNSTSSNETVGHGLGVKPDMLIAKNRDFGYNWDIYNSSLGYNASLTFTTAATRSGAFGTSEPTSSVFRTSPDFLTRGTDKYVVYCFASKKGYSKFGTFTGNQNTNGTFIYTGFKPAWVMFKEATGSATGDNWFMYDNKRSTFNQTQKYLRANLSNAEQDNSAGAIDMLSNGFKIRTADASLNDSGETYVFMAFAESPFVNSNGIPNNAR